MSTVDLMKAWADHAARPFQGMQRSDIQEQLVIAIGMAIRVAAPLVRGLSDVIIAYKWSEKNVITVEMNPEEITQDMLIVKGEAWV